MKNFFRFKNKNIHLATTYFYQLRFFKDNMIPLSICIYDPKWYKNDGGFNIKEFVPIDYNSNLDCENCHKLHKDDPLYNGNLNCRYLKEYRKQLKNLNIEKIIKEQCWKILNSKKYKQQIEKYNDVYLVFVGFEVPDKLCSERFILANYIEENLNIHCKELKYPIIDNY